MEMRVEQLSAQADVSVDTVRYYQSKGLLARPAGRGASPGTATSTSNGWPGSARCSSAGFTLATIARLVSGDLDAADEALLGRLVGPGPPGTGATAGSAIPGPGPGPAAPDGSAYTLDELAGATGIPLALLKALEAEGLLIPTRVAGQDATRRRTWPRRGPGCACSSGASP